MEPSDTDTQVDSRQASARAVSPGEAVVFIDELATFEHEQIVDSNFEYLEPRSGLPDYGIPIRGWVLGSSSPAEWVEVSAQRGDLFRLPVKLAREDIAEAFGDVPWAGECGFRGQLGAAGLPRRFHLNVDVVLADGTRLKIAGITGERRSLPLVTDTRFQPVLVTTIGRTGSSWLTWLLGHHPELIAYRTFEYEPRVTGYCAAIVNALSQPSSYLQSLRGDVYAGDWWLGREFQYPHYPFDHTFEEWLGTRHVEDLVEFFMRRIDAFYRRIAELGEKPAAGFLVEKQFPVSFVQDMLWEVYPGTREIFLVRDPRDIGTSVLAFNARRGFAAFGREEVENDEDFIRGPLRRDTTELLRAWSRRSQKGHLLRYEDLIDDPRRTLALAFSYIGVDNSVGTVERVIEQAQEQDPTAKKDHQTASSAKASIGRWRADLDDALRHACAESLAESLDAFGYPP